MVVESAYQHTAMRMAVQGPIGRESIAFLCDIPGFLNIGITLRSRVHSWRTLRVGALHDGALHTLDALGMQGGMPSE
jgi:hypothetical protein